MAAILVQERALCEGTKRYMAEHLVLLKGPGKMIRRANLAEPDNQKGLVLMGGIVSRHGCVSLHSETKTVSWMEASDPERLGRQDRQTYNYGKEIEDIHNTETVLSSMSEQMVTLED